MVKKLTLFDKKWLKDAQAPGVASSWTCDVMRDLDTAGGLYLCTLQQWFEDLPLSNNQKRKLKTEIEGFENAPHLGAVNELAWWKFLLKSDFKAQPIPASSTNKPDFKVTAPVEFFTEVTTLNVSNKEKTAFRQDGSVALDHSETIRRVLGKMTDQKHKQMSYAADKKQPCVLVIFDYTEWSAYGTQFFSYLAEFLLGQESGFQKMPSELSALAYIERKVLDGRIAISSVRSAIYQNPHAKHHLPLEVFSSLNRYWGQRELLKSDWQEDWIYLL